VIGAAHDGILAALRAGLPGLRDVLGHGTVDGLDTPAAVLRLAELAPDDAPEDGSGQLAVRCRWEVFLVLAGRTPGAARALHELAGAVAVLVQGNRFGLAARPARFVLAEPDEFGPQWKGADVWRVEFEQVLPLGADVWTGQGVAVQTVLASLSPRIGLAHEDDYEEISGEQL